MSTKQPKKIGASREYEKLVQRIYQAILAAQDITVEVKHDVLLKGTSREHQLDVYWEYRLGGITHRVIINCKNYKRAVEGTDVYTLAGVLQDFPGARGVIVTTKGFQAGALEFAKTHNVGLKIIRPPIDEDYEGRIREIEIHMELKSARVSGVSLKYDGPWVDNHLSAEQRALLTGPHRLRNDRVTVKDLATGTTVTLHKLTGRLPLNLAADIDHEHEYTWSDARLMAEGIPEAKLNSIKFIYRVHNIEEVINVKPKDPEAIVRDAIDGTLLFIDGDATVSGDIEAEGIKRKE